MEMSHEVAIVINRIFSISLLPANASEQGNVIGLVSVYIVIYIAIYQFWSELGI